MKYLDLDELRELICEHFDHDGKKRQLSSDSEIVSIETEFIPSRKYGQLDLLDSIVDLGEDLVEGRVINGIEVTMERIDYANTIRIKTYIWVQAH